MILTIFLAVVFCAAITIMLIAAAPYENVKLPVMHNRK